MASLAGSRYALIAMRRGAAGLLVMIVHYAPPRSEKSGAFRAAWQPLPS
jgi:hypothetical protein